MIKRYYLGGPIFSHPNWCGTLFPKKARTDEFLTHYSRVMNSVEGNNTFYGLPRVATVARWAEQIPRNFRFCFKFPRTVSHEGFLTSTESTGFVTEFLETLRPIRRNVGVLLLQLPPYFDGTRLDELTQFLEALPSGWDYAVEPRHADFFDEANLERHFDCQLADLNVNRCLFDTSLLHAVQTESDVIREAQRKKPNFPERWTVTSDKPVLRYVGDDSVHGNVVRLERVADKVAGWIRADKTPFVFLHTPSDDDVPELCRVFHQMMINRTSVDVVGPMPDWPGELEPKQMSLF